MGKTTQLRRMVYTIMKKAFFPDVEYKNDKTSIK